MLYIGRGASVAASLTDDAAGGCSRCVTLDGVKSSSLKASGFTDQSPTTTVR